MQQIVFSKNNLFFYFLLFGYIFGVLLYDFIEFKYTDELMALFLIFFTGIIVWERKKIQELRPLLLVGGVFLFYTLYSFAIHSNVPQAIIKDLIIQAKPFFGFYCAYLLAPTLTQVQKRFLAIICLIVGGLITIVGLTGYTYIIFGHPSRLATASTVTALLFLYCSTYSWSDIFAFIILLATGFFSTRSKFYGFWGVACFLVIYCKSGGLIKLNIRTILVGCFISIIALWLAWDKIILYYVDGMMSSKEMWSRPAMQFTSFQIFCDYFPFGSGLASFGTFTSGEYYSATYEEYGINHLWGISKDKPDFIADAFYPELAQFGIVGVILYFGFWISILRLAIKKQVSQQKMFIFTLLAFMFFFIEGFADSTFTHNRGLFILILTGIVLLKDEKKGQYI